MDHHTKSSDQRKNAPNSEKLSAPENENLSVGSITQNGLLTSNIQTLQAHLGNQAILRLLSSQAPGKTLVPRRRGSIQRAVTTTDDKTQDEQTEENEFQDVDLTSDIDTVDTDGDSGSEGEPDPDENTKPELLPSNSQIISKPLALKKMGKKKLGFFKRVMQFLPGKSGKKALSSAISGGMGVKGFRKAIKQTKEVTQAADTLAPTLVEFIHNIVGTKLSHILVTAADLISKAIHSDAVQSAVLFLSDTLQPVYESVVGFLEPVISVLEGVVDALPFVSGALQICKSAISIISGIYHSLTRFLTAKTLYKGMSSKSDVVKDVSNYGLRKVLRSVAQKVYETGRSVLTLMRGITNLSLDIASVCTYASTQIGKAVTLGVGIADSLVNLQVQGYRAVKGGIKAIKGTRGMGRENHATDLVDAAIKGDTDAQNMIVSLGAYGLAGRIQRSMTEGRNTLVDNVFQPFGNKTGLSKTEESDITIAFYKWGQYKMKDFYMWMKSKYKVLTENGVFEGVFKTIWNLLKDLLSVNTTEGREFLKKDIQTHGASKKSPWRKGVIQYIALKLKST